MERRLVLVQGDRIVGKAVVLGQDSEYGGCHTNNISMQGLINDSAGLEDYAMAEMSEVVGNNELDK